MIWELGSERSTLELVASCATFLFAFVILGSACHRASSASLIVASTCYWKKKDIRPSLLR